MDLCWQSDISAILYTVYVCHSFSSKKQVFLNFMTAVTIHSDFGAQKKNVCHCVLFFLPSICHAVMGLDAKIWVFWMLSVKPTPLASWRRTIQGAGVVTGRIDSGRGMSQADGCSWSPHTSNSWYLGLSQSCLARGLGSTVDVVCQTPRQLSYAQSFLGSSCCVGTSDHRRASSPS